MNTRLPKHLQVKERILALIVDAKPGTAVPTERELARSFDTSRTTVRLALAALSADGRLARTQGRGTFVTEPRRVLVRQLTSYSDDLRAQGRDPSSQVLAVGRVPAEARVAAQLEIAEGAQVHRVERVRGVGGESLAHETAHLAGDLPGLPEALAHHGSLYTTLRVSYGIRLTRVEDLVETVLADPVEARVLDIDLGVPLLLIHRTGWGPDDRPVEFTRSVFRGDRFSFVARSAVPDPA